MNPGYNNKGRRKYECADCKNTQMEHWTAMARRCKPRCQKCGSTFLLPYSEGANEMDVNAGTARAILDKTPPISGRENVQMRGEKDIPGAKR